ncbi:MAG: chemotaxis protein CheW [Pseudohongiellaceae bacterium]|nr:chemotaxis protein CheW [Pseudohongiellaceae bacterium]
MTMGQTTADEIAGVNAEGDQYLTFILAGEEYGIDILRVQEIRGWTKTTAIPNAPDYLRGVINLRGTIVPIIDLRERFGMDALEYGPTTVVIVVKAICEERDRIMGIVVDAVSEVYSLQMSELQPPPDLGNVVDEQFLQGLVTVDEKMVILLDIDLLLNAGALAVEKASA